MTLLRLLGKNGKQKNNLEMLYVAFFLSFFFFFSLPHQFPVFIVFCCTQANGLDIVGLTREEAVAHLTGLEGQVTLAVQYRKEGQ